MELIKKDTNIDFMGMRKIAFGISVALIVISLLSLLIRGLNFGIDFTGGTLVAVNYDSAVEVGEVRGALEEAGFDDAVVQYFGTARDIQVRLPAAGADSAAGNSSAVMEALRSPYGETLDTEVDPGRTTQQCVSGGEAADCKVQMRLVEFVGPQVGEELANDGGLAMLIALVCILIYVWLRFEWKFSIGSVAALAHDVTITLGIFSVFQFDFSLPVLAAVLAVIGYSLNDTIVVFDRIRENFRKMRKGTPAQVINSAVNQTLRRTLLTSITTLLVVLTLLLIGGEIIRGFSIALLIGVLVGTYSSIFIASPIVLQLGVSREELMPVKKEGAEMEEILP